MVDDQVADDQVADGQAPDDLTQDYKDYKHTAPFAIGRGTYS